MQVLHHGPCWPKAEAKLGPVNFIKMLLFLLHLPFWTKGGEPVGNYWGKGETITEWDTRILQQWRRYQHPASGVREMWE